MALSKSELREIESFRSNLSRPEGTTDAQWSETVRLGAALLLHTNGWLQMWYVRDGVLRVRSVDPSGRKLADRKTSV